MNELPLRESTIQNLENRRSNSMQDPENSKRKGEVCKRLGFEKIQNEYKKYTNQTTVIREKELAKS